MTDNPSEAGADDFVSRPVGDTVEFKLDPVIAKRIKDLKLGINGCRRHSWRALAIKVTGYDDQMTGSDLERLACWTLGQECWCGRCVP